MQVLEYRNKGVFECVSQTVHEYSLDFLLIHFLDAAIVEIGSTELVSLPSEPAVSQLIATVNLDERTM